MSYQTIIAELRYCARRNKTRVYPIPGQPFPVNMRIECSRRIRDMPLGTKIRIVVKLKDTYHESQHLYSHHSWDYEVIR